MREGSADELPKQERKKKQNAQVKQGMLVSFLNNSSKRREIRK
jgi:hypothetical protein